MSAIDSISPFVTVKTMAATGTAQSLVQLLMVLVGAALIAATVQGLKAEWQALFKKPFGGAAARILVYFVSGMFQAYNGYAHRGIPTWEVVVLALLTAFCATGFYSFAKKRWPA